jgi:flagellar hook-length control protein FliK
MNLSALSLTSPTTQRHQPPVAIKPVATQGLGGPTARSTKPPVVAAPPDLVAPVQTKPVVVAPVQTRPVVPSFSMVLSQAHQGQASPTGAAHAQRADERQPPQKDPASKAPPRTTTGTNPGHSAGNSAGPKNAPRPATRGNGEKPVASTPVRAGGDKTGPVVDEASPSESTTSAKEAQDNSDELATLLAGLPNALQTPPSLDKSAAAATDMDTTTAVTGEAEVAGNGTQALGAAAERNAKLTAANLRDDATAAGAANGQPSDWQAAVRAAAASQTDAGNDGHGSAAGDTAPGASAAFNSNNDSSTVLVTASGSVPVGAAAPNALAGDTQAIGYIKAHPGSADFAPQLGAQLSSFVRDGVQHAQLELNPAEMGPLSLQIQLDGNTATVNLSAENALTREALEKAMPTLASSLREAGLTLSGGGVFEQPQRSAQDPSQGSAQGQSQNKGGAGVARQSTDDREGRLTQPLLPPRSRGVVDLVA